MLALESQFPLIMAYLCIPQVHPKAFYEATSKVITALDTFKPNLILVSAGFDAHQVRYAYGWKGMKLLLLI